MWKNILQASKITEATQFIVSYAKNTEQISCTILFCYMQQHCVKEKRKKSQSYKIYQIFFISGSGCSKLTTSLVNASLKFQILIQSTLVIPTSIISNNRLSRRGNLVLV